MVNKSVYDRKRAKLEIARCLCRTTHLWCYWHSEYYYACLCDHFEARTGIGMRRCTGYAPRHNTLSELPQLAGGLEP